jgi:hypothetical protein
MCSLHNPWSAYTRTLRPPTCHLATCQGDHPLTAAASHVSGDVAGKPASSVTQVSVQAHVVREVTALTGKPANACSARRPAGCVQQQSMRSRRAVSASCAERAHGPSYTALRHWLTVPLTHACQIAR